MHLYEVRPRKDHRGVDLISDVLPFGRLWYGGPDATTNAIRYVKSVEGIRIILGSAFAKLTVMSFKRTTMGRVQEAAGVCHEQPLGQSTITREVGTLDNDASGCDTK